MTIHNEKYKRALLEVAEIVTPESFIAQDKPPKEFSDNTLEYSGGIFFQMRAELKFYSQPSQYFETAVDSLKELANDIVHLSLGAMADLDPYTFLGCNHSSTGTIQHDVSFILRNIHNRFSPDVDQSDWGYGDEMPYSINIQFTINTFPPLHTRLFEMCNDFLIDDDRLSYMSIVTLFYRDKEDYLEALLLVNSDET